MLTYACNTISTQGYTHAKQATVNDNDTARVGWVTLLSNTQ
jgi:hypothetical protein